MPNNAVAQSRRRANQSPEERAAKNLHRQQLRAAGATVPWYSKIASMIGCYKTLLWNRRCTFCQLVLLQGEINGWCCSSGKRKVPTLQPLPVGIAALELIPNISSLSLRLNKLFNLAVTGVDSGQWERPRGPQQ
jgi:hypothetical protein